MNDDEQAQDEKKFIDMVTEYELSINDVVRQREALKRQLAEANATIARLEKVRASLQTCVHKLETALNMPEILDFAQAVNSEAAHQRERWGMEHDTEKTDADWFWLVGYLAGKALHIPEKRLHHLVTTAAALANWHYYCAKAEAGRKGGT